MKNSHKRMAVNDKIYLSGKAIPRSFIRLVRLTPFQRSVLKACSSIPFGQTRSYKWIAQRLGKPKASRAVGQALNKNPFPVLIPCHRVVSFGGDIGGYSRGRRLKKYLLQFEKNIGDLFKE